MHGTHGGNGSPQTFCADLSVLSFEMIEQQLGYATVIRFSIPNETIRMGDILVVMDGQGNSIPRDSQFDRQRGMGSSL